MYLRAADDLMFIRLCSSVRKIHEIGIAAEYVLHLICYSEREWSPEVIGH